MLALRAEKYVVGQRCMNILYSKSICILGYISLLQIYPRMYLTLLHWKSRPGVEPATSRIWQHRQH
jgi:hypothetical protein